MSITAISGNDPFALQTFFSQPRKDLQALATDLSSGNLAGAQKDFASLQQDVSNAFQSVNNATGLSPAANGMPGGTGATADLQALQSALNSNDLAAAQKQFSTFQQDIRAFGFHRDHHHRHYHFAQDGDQQESQPDTTGTATGNTTTNNNSVPDFTMAAMVAAYKAFGSSSLANATNMINAVA